jgi:hypothetical protein
MRRMSPETDGGLIMKAVSFARRTVVALAACAALCAMPVAGANTLQTIGWASGNGFNEIFSVTTPTANGVPTGGFTGKWNGTPIIFWCYELTQYFSLGGTYTNYTAYTPPIAPPPITAGQVTELSELFTEAFAHALDSASNSAAFQLAIWEIEYETASGPLSLSTGNFHVTYNGDTAALNQANTWLAGLPSTGDYTITELYSADNQNFIYGTFTLREAPEPPLLSLLGVALAALTLVWRWQSAGRRRA